MSDVMLKFWQEWYDENKMEWEPVGKVVDWSISFEIEHDGGYGYCEYDADVYLEFTIEKEGETEAKNKRGYPSFTLDNDELRSLIVEAINFDPSNLG